MGWQNGQITVTVEHVSIVRDDAFEKAFIGITDKLTV